MIDQCPYCRTPLPHHDSDCRVPGDLDRLERVLDRLSGQHRRDPLTDSLERVLVTFGRHPDQPAVVGV